MVGRLSIGVLAASVAVSCAAPPPPSSPPVPAIEAIGPRVMSTLATASFGVRAMSGFRAVPPVVPEPILVSSGCEVELLTHALTTEPRWTVRSPDERTCDVAMGLRDGERLLRVNHSVRFFAVPTLVSDTAPHWLDACPKVRRADRFGDRVVCDTGDEVVEHGPERTTRHAGRLTATDGRGGWVVCDAGRCRIRLVSGEWGAIEGTWLAPTRWRSLREPPDSIVGIATTRSRDVAKVISRHDASVTTLPDAGLELRQAYIVSGVVLFGEPGRFGSARAWLGEALTPPLEPISGFLAQDATPFAWGNGSDGRPALLVFDAGRRLAEARTIEMPGEHPGALVFVEGLQGSAAAVLLYERAWVHVHVDENDRVSLAVLDPVQAIDSSGRTARVLVTPDTIAFADEDGTPLKRFRIVRPGEATP